MQKHRIISGVSILAMLLIPVIGWFLIAQPQFAAAATADAERANIESQTQALQATVTQLEAKSKEIPKLNEQLNELRASIPADVDSSNYIDGLSALAAASSVAITALTVADPIAYQAAIPPVDPNAVAPDPKATPDPSATATPPPAPVADPAIVTNPLITSSSFVTVPVTIEVAGSYSSILGFVKGLQSGGRLFLVAKIETTPNTAIAADGTTSVGGLTAKIGGFIYAIPTGLPGNPHPTSTIVKVMDSGTPAVTTGDGTTGDGTEGTDGTGSTPTPNPTTTP